MEFNKKLRCYSFDYGADYNFSIIANNLKEAKKIGIDHIVSSYGLTLGVDIEFIDIRVQWRPEVDAKQCNSYGFGVVEDWEKALELDIYYTVYTECSKCSDETSIQKWDNGLICCEECFNASRESEEN